MELIHAYSRKQALADGVLVDVTSTAKEAGFRYPVALTAAVWAEAVVVPEGVEGQDEDGRLWDVLWMLRYAATAQKRDTSTLLFQVQVRTPKGLDVLELKALCGPGDDAEPVITVMLPHED